MNTLPSMIDGVGNRHRSGSSDAEQVNFPMFATRAVEMQAN